MIEVSVILPTYNEESRIERCIKSVIDQDYPISIVEIIVVDDNSTDDTVAIAKRLGAIVIQNGSKNIEKGKSLGLAKAKGEFIFFIDADNVLLTKDWFKLAIAALKKDKEIIGVQSYKYKYYKSDRVANRYCSLFGINDPMVFYLGKRGQLMFGERQWMYPETLIDSTKNFIICEFTPQNLPTVGSQGYMTRKSLLKMTNWKSYLYHMDSIYELVTSGHSKIAFIKKEIRHDYTSSVFNLLKKLRRNIVLFHNQSEDRKYKYEMSPLRLLKVVLIMTTFVIPFRDAYLGYRQKNDMAWFLHPLICVSVVGLYSYTTIEQKVIKLFER